MVYSRHTRTSYFILVSSQKNRKKKCRSLFVCCLERCLCCQLGLDISSSTTTTTTTTSYPPDPAVSIAVMCTLGTAIDLDGQMDGGRVANTCLLATVAVDRSIVYQQTAAGNGWLYPPHGAHHPAGSVSKRHGTSLKGMAHRWLDSLDR